MRERLEGLHELTHDTQDAPRVFLDEAVAVIIHARQSSVMGQGKEAEELRGKGRPLPHSI